TRVATEIKYTPAGAKAGQRLAIVPLVEEEARLVLAARSHAKTGAVLGDDRGRRRLWLAAIERLLLLHVLFREPIKGAVRVVRGERFVDRRAKAIHAGGEPFQNQDWAKTIHDQAAQAIAFGVD